MRKVLLLLIIVVWIVWTNICFGWMEEYIFPNSTIKWFRNSSCVNVDESIYCVWWMSMSWSSIIYWSVFLYNDESMSKQLFPTWIKPRHSTSCINSDWKIYCFGWFYNTSSLYQNFNTIFTYLPTNIEIVETEPYTTIEWRMSSSCSLIWSIVYCIWWKQLSSSGSKYFDEILKYDIANNRFDKVNFSDISWGNTIINREMHSCVAYKSKIYCFGWRNVSLTNSLKTLDSMIIFDPMANTIQQIKFNDISDWVTISRRYGVSCSIFGDMAYCFGWSDDPSSVFLDSILIYDFKENKLKEEKFWNNIDGSAIVWRMNLSCASRSKDIICLWWYWVNNDINRILKYTPIQTADILPPDWLREDNKYIYYEPWNILFNYDSNNNLSPEWKIWVQEELNINAKDLFKWSRSADYFMINNYSTSDSSSYYNNLSSLSVLCTGDNNIYISDNRYTNTLWVTQDQKKRLSMWWWTGLFRLIFDYKSNSTDTQNSQRLSYNINFKCEENFEKPSELLPYQEKDTLYKPDELISYSIADYDTKEFSSWDVQDKFLTPKPDIQPTFSDILYLQLRSMTNLISSLDKLWIGSDKFKDLFFDSNYYNDYLSWIKHFWWFETKQEFVDAMVWWITLKDIWVANDIILWLSQRLECEYSWLIVCDTIKVKISKSYSKKFDFYTMDDIVNQLFSKTNQHTIWDTYLWLYNDILSLTWTISWISDQNQKSQAMKFLSFLLTENINDLESNDHIDVWYAMSQRIKNLEMMKQKIISDIQEDEKFNILWLYNFYFEVNNISKWTQKAVMYKSSIQNWELTWFLMTQISSQDQEEITLIKWDVVDMPKINEIDLNLEIIEQMRSILNIDPDAQWEEKIKFIWWTIDYDKIKTYKDKHNLFFILKKVLKTRSIEWEKNIDSQYCFHLNEQQNCFENYKKINKFTMITYVFDLNQIDDLSKFGKYFILKKGLQRWLMMHYDFDKNINDTAWLNLNWKIVWTWMYYNWILWESFLFNWNSHIEVLKSENRNFHDSFTVSVWIFTNKFNKIWQTIISKWDSSWRIHRSSREWTNNNQISFWSTDKSSWNYIFDDLMSLDRIELYKWYNIVIVYDAIARKKELYINKMLVWTQNDVTISDNNYRIWIWDNAEMIWRNFVWLIDELSLYDRKLSSKEIRTLYDIVLDN